MTMRKPCGRFNGGPPFVEVCDFVRVEYTSVERVDVSQRIEDRLRNLGPGRTDVFGCTAVPDISAGRCGGVDAIVYFPGGFPCGTREEQSALFWKIAAAVVKDWNGCEDLGRSAVSFSSKPNPGEDETVKWRLDEIVSELESESVTVGGFLWGKPLEVNDMDPLEEVLCDGMYYIAQGDRPWMLFVDIWSYVKKDEDDCIQQ
jgi:hypothetical protein